MAYHPVGMLAEHGEVPLIKSHLYLSHSYTCACKLFSFLWNESDLSALHFRFALCKLWGGALPGGEPEWVQDSRE